MATAVFFHAHPDDEAISTGGTMAKAARDGHRVVVVCATRGEQGIPMPAVLVEGEELWERRAKELEEACRILGVARLEYLGYQDSGMIGEPSNSAPDSFWRADLEEAAGRLARILSEENADVLTIYDEDGGYGHPDHIQVHRTGLRAAELATTPKVFMATINRDQLKDFVERGAEIGFEAPQDLRDAADTMGVPAAMITTAVDVSDFLEHKRRAMRTHASQIDEASVFLAMPPEIFALAFGTEWYMRVGTEPSGELGTSLFD